jgi:hypothetical protein
MKRTPALFVLTFALASLLRAQEASPAAPGRLQLAPAAAPTPLTPDSLPEVTLVPEPVPQKKKPDAAAAAAVPVDKEKKSKTEESSEEVTQRVHFREARTKALRDPQVQAEWERATHAKTDLIKREALQTYYKLLYARILKIDGSVKKLADLRQTASMHRLEQTRIDATEPLDPDERAERFERGE